MEFDEYVTGLMELTVGKKNLKLNVNILDKRKLKSIIGIKEELNSKVAEKRLKQIDDIFLDILFLSYPNEKKEGLEGFYVQHDNEFLQEFLIKVGWIEREDMEEKKESAPK